jgi:hypothetical protein
MLIFRVPCTVTKLGGHNLYGEEVAGKKTREQCAVVELKTSFMHTSLRTDKTATVGAAEELLGAATLLFSIKSSVNIGDTIVMDTGERLKVISRVRRYTPMGKADHYEIGCAIG